MLLTYIQKAMDDAHYEIIDDAEPFYGEIKALKGVWATGKTLEACRANLAKAVEDWVLFSVAQNFPVPSLGNVSLHLPEKVAA